eukprot:scaffold2908_cov105-Isochrysis_galbana.AAC.18
MREPRKKLCRVGMGRGGVQVGGARLDHVDQDDRQLGGRASPAADGRLGQPCPPVHSADGAGCGSWLRHCDGRSQLGLGRPFVGRGTECMEERLRGGSVLIAAARAHKTPERTSGQRHSGPSVDKGLLEKRHQPETRRLAGRGDKAPDRIPRRWQEPGKTDAEPWGRASVAGARGGGEPSTAASASARQAASAAAVHDGKSRNISPAASLRVAEEGVAAAAASASRDVATSGSAASRRIASGETAPLMALGADTSRNMSPASLCSATGKPRPKAASTPATMPAAPSLQPGSSIINCAKAPTSRAQRRALSGAGTSAEAVSRVSVVMSGGFCATASRNADSSGARTVAKASVTKWTAIESGAPFRAHAMSLLIEAAMAEQGASRGGSEPLPWPELVGSEAESGGIVIAAGCVEGSWKAWASMSPSAAEDSSIARARRLRQPSAARRDRHISCAAGARRLGCVGQSASADSTSDATRVKDAEKRATASSAAAAVGGEEAKTDAVTEPAPNASLVPDASPAAGSTACAPPPREISPTPSGDASTAASTTTSNRASASACSARGAPGRSSACSSGGTHLRTTSAAAAGAHAATARSSLPPTAAPAACGRGKAHTPRKGVRICSSKERGSDAQLSTPFSPEVFGVDVSAGDVFSRDASSGAVPAGDIPGTDAPCGAAARQAAVRARIVAQMASSRAVASSWVGAATPLPPARWLSSWISCARIA